MSLKNIVIEPDPILRKRSEPLEEVNNDTRKLLDEMLQTMYAAPGIGLAAVQIGILKRIIVVDVSKKMKKKNLFFLLILKLYLNLKKLHYLKRDVYHYQDILLKQRDQQNARSNILIITANKLSQKQRVFYLLVFNMKLIT